MPVLTLTNRDINGHLHRSIASMISIDDALGSKRLTHKGLPSCVDAELA